MLYVSNSATSNRTVMVLRLASHAGQASSYIEMLKEYGLNLIECFTPETAQYAVNNGCRIGLLIVTQEWELAQLDNCESFFKNDRISWVGLIAQGLITLPRMREFIGEHLFNFITMPSSRDHIELTLRHAWGMSLVHEAPQRASVASLPNDADFAVLGKTPEMQLLLSQIQKVARADASILITGPSGAGKEVSALSIHRQSTRRKGPFVAVNCATIAPQLFQSELFGHEPDASAGINQRKIGCIEEAQGGILFLDEIGNMPPEMQTKLLRFLQTKTIERTGGAPIEIDVRVIATSSVDLAEAVRQRRFREDLYYRINVVCIDIPPLADRGQDIEDIARHYFARFASIHNRSLRGFSKAAMNAMLCHRWPGNVRELVNRVQRATIMAEGRFIQPEDLGFERHTEHAQTMSLEDARAAAESVMIRRALSQSRNQISRAASLLGVSRVTLYRLIEKYNIRSDAVPPTNPLLLSSVKPELEVRK